MPDHLHFFIIVPQEIPHALSDWMKALKRTLAKVLAEIGVPSPHWQKGFFDHVMRVGRVVLAEVGLCAEQSVSAGFVAEADAWPYKGEICKLRF